MSTDPSDEIQYVTSDGRKVYPRHMTTIHIRNAIRSLQLKKEDDCAVYKILCAELQKRMEGEKDERQGSFFDQGAESSR